MSPCDASPNSLQRLCSVPSEDHTPTCNVAPSCISSKISRLVSRRSRPAHLVVQPTVSSMALPLLPPIINGAICPVTRPWTPTVLPTIPNSTSPAEKINKSWCSRHSSLIPFLRSLPLTRSGTSHSTRERSVVLSVSHVQLHRRGPPCRPIHDPRDEPLL